MGDGDGGNAAETLHDLDRGGKLQGLASTKLDVLQVGIAHDAELLLGHGFAVAF